MASKATFSLRPTISLRRAYPLNGLRRTNWKNVNRGKGRQKRFERCCLGRRNSIVVTKIGFFCARENFSENDKLRNCVDSILEDQEQALEILHRCFVRELLMDCAKKCRVWNAGMKPRHPLWIPLHTIASLGGFFVCSYRMLAFRAIAILPLLISFAFLVWARQDFFLTFCVSWNLIASSF